MSKEKKKLPKRQFSLSNVNGLVLVAALLTTTVLVAGVSEAKYQRLANEMSKVTEFNVDKEMKLASCPLVTYTPNSVVRESGHGLPAQLQRITDVR